MDLMKLIPLPDRFEYPVFNFGSDPITNDAVPASHKGARGWGYRRLARFKTVNGIRYQLHATRGWKKLGRIT
ncbi:hypothetical protein [Pukyongiella litopenaei]|uniref:Uncharacterized protein n=1 Tax=Pukyongiella litopenaei TaxID=2605946 RepID=A0A2S0MLC1_9RHOB|nr:hypothetical protein [Pukyongiella litopenaei]AVO36617.1 hypothetical protein C6Y53_02155 [Pukyongiella litopenaei]